MYVMYICVLISAFEWRLHILFLILPNEFWKFKTHFRRHSVVKVERWCCTKWKGMWWACNFHQAGVMYRTAYVLRGWLGRIGLASRVLGLASPIKTSIAAQLGWTRRQDAADTKWSSSKWPMLRAIGLKRQHGRLPAQSHLTNSRLE